MIKRAKIPELELQYLSDDVLAEVVRQAELRLGAQYQSHLGLMTRGFTLAGFLLAGITALIVAAINQSENQRIVDLVQSRLIIAFLVSLITAAVFSLMSALPRKFDIPGVEPCCWNIKDWTPPKGSKRDMKQARLSYLEVLQGQITRNRRSNGIKAYLQLASFVLVLVAVVFVAIYLYLA